LKKVRGNGRLFVAGSSFGALVSLELAFRYPTTYVGVASLSGALWPGEDTNTAFRDQLPGFGKKAFAIYMDWGGNPQTNADNAAYNVEVRDMLLGLGWQSGCTFGQDALCWYYEPNALHNEIAWRARVWRFLRFLFPA